MKNNFYLFLFLLFLVSCDSASNSVAYDMFSKIEKADSLYHIDEKAEAVELLNGIIKYDNHISEPSPFNMLMWMFISDVDEKEGEIYYGYLFTYLIQMDALELLCQNEENREKRIQILKQLFDLSCEFDEVMDRYIARSISSGFYEYIDRYNETFTENNLVNKIDCYSSDSDFPSYMYCRKWSLMNILLIESDLEYGYEKTFAYFDSILEYHGASTESYLKTLVKSYMSFSGVEKYRYDSGMNYDDFKTISLAVSSDDWFVSFNEYLYFKERTSDIIKKEGIVVEYDTHQIYNPSLIELLIEDGKRILVVNKDNECLEYEMEGWNWHSEFINLDISLLSAMLYKHGKGEMVPKILKSKQYFKNDTLVREGFENDFYKIICYDENFNFLSSRLYSDEKKPACDSFGVHCLKRLSYGDSIVEFCFYNVNGNLCLNKAGYAKSISKYDTDGKLIEESFYTEEGYAKSIIKFYTDGKLNFIEESFYEVDGKLCINTEEGCAKRIIKSDATMMIESLEFDNCGNLLFAYSLDTVTGIDVYEMYNVENGNLCLNKAGYAKIVEKYDTDGNLIEKSFYEVAGELCVNTEVGFAKVGMKYGKNGRLISEEYYGADGKPCIFNGPNGGYAKVEAKYDESGNMLGLFYYGVDGELYMNQAGFAKVEWRYDENSRLISTEYYGIDGKPCIFNGLNGGFAKVEWRYDENGRLISEEFYGADGKPCIFNSPNGPNGGYAKAEAKYDENGNMLGLFYYGVDGLLLGE